MYVDALDYPEVKARRAKDNTQKDTYSSPEGRDTTTALVLFLLVHNADIAAVSITSTTLGTGEGKRIERK